MMWLSSTCAELDNPGTFDHTLPRTHRWAGLPGCGWIQTCRHSAFHDHDDCWYVQRRLVIYGL